MDLTKDSITFLGFGLKANKEGDSCVGGYNLGSKGGYRYTKTSIAPKNIPKIIRELKSKIKKIIRCTNAKERIALTMLFNICLLGYHNYWNIASECSTEFYQIHLRLSVLWKKLKNQADSKTYISHTFHLLYDDYVESAFSILGITVYPIWGCRHQTVPIKKRNYNYYEEKTHIPGNIKSQLRIMCRNPILNRSVEYNDNRLSKYSMQNGLDVVTGKFMLAQDVHCHHVIMRTKGGDDSFGNLVIVSSTTHGWIHQIEPEIPYLKKKHFDKLNEFRLKCDRKPLKNKK